MNLNIPFVIWLGVILAAGVKLLYAPPNEKNKFRIVLAYILTFAIAVGSGLFLTPTLMTLLGIPTQYYLVASIIVALSSESILRQMAIIGSKMKLENVLNKTLPKE